MLSCSFLPLGKKKSEQILCWGTQPGSWAFYLPTETQMRPGKNQRLLPKTGLLFSSKYVWSSFPAAGFRSQEALRSWADPGKEPEERMEGDRRLHPLRSVRSSSQVEDPVLAAWVGVGGRCARAPSGASALLGLCRICPGPEESGCQGNRAAWQEAISASPGLCRERLAPTSWRRVFP